MTDEFKFWNKIDKNGPVIRPELGQCWIWTGARVKRPNGEAAYGRFYCADGKTQYAHRKVYALANGINYIESGLYVLHKCDNPPCCNPDHLFIGTPLDNTRDMFNKNRANKARGEDHGLNKLLYTQIEYIRDAVKQGIQQKTLAKELGISRAQICRIVNHVRWRD